MQQLGVFLDDVTLPDGTSTSFEAGLDGWQVTGPPAGSGPNANNWTRTDATRSNTCSTEQARPRGRRLRRQG